jgi:DNA polymerase III subunit epsilon
LHGALLDAGLLAEVYIRLTRGQDSLVIDTGGAASASGGVANEPLASLAAFTLYAVTVGDDERSAHEAVLAELDKASSGKTVWRRMA